MRNVNQQVITDEVYSTEESNFLGKYSGAEWLIRILQEFSGQTPGALQNSNNKYNSVIDEKGRLVSLLLDDISRVILANEAAYR